MGVRSGKDILSSKWITAKITDKSNRCYFVPIKHKIGDYFLAEIEGNIYCFKLTEKIQVYYHTLVKHFKIIDYNIDHYMPIDASENKELENVLRKNALPKMNMMLFNILKLLGKREDPQAKFEPHNLEKLVEEVSEHEKEYKERVESIKNYLSHLNVKQIVTPVRRVTEFIEGDLIATDPKFLGAVVTQHRITDQEHRKVTNTPERGKIAWIKIMLIVTIVSLVVGLAYWAYDSGVFENVMPSLPTFGGTSFQPSPMSQYKTPEAAKAAIDRGELDYNSLSADEKRMIDTVKLPQVEPKQ